MAAALAKVLRGGRRSGASSQLLLQATGRRLPQEGVVGRLMHTGQWQNPALSGGTGSIKAPGRMEISSKRFQRGEQFEDLPDHPFVALAAASAVASVIGLIYTLPSIYRGIKGLMKPPL